jgi:very-short-patch-repair endonuclease
MNGEAEARIRTRAAGQHRLVTRNQLLGDGLTASAIDARVRRGWLRIDQRGVYRLERDRAGTCDSIGSVKPGTAAGLGTAFETGTAVALGTISGPATAFEAGWTEVMAAVLSCPGSAASHLSAAFLWEIAQAAPDAVHITVRHGCGRRRGIWAHRAELQVDEVTELRGIPVTTLARTVLDLAGVLGPGDLEQVLAHAVRRGLARGDLERLVARYPGRRGIAALRGLLSEWQRLAVTRSRAEAECLALVRRAQLPRPETNVRLAGFEVDFLWRGAKFVVEVDGFAYHSSRSSFERDRHRDATLLARGYRVLRVTWRQITNEPEAVIARLAQVLAHASGDGGERQVNRPLETPRVPSAQLPGGIGT